MAKLPRFTRFLTEDFPEEQREGLGKVLVNLNTFMQSVTSALTRNITVNQNIAGQIKTLSVTGGSTLKFKYDVSIRPQTLIVGKVVKVGSAATTGPVTIDTWSDDGVGNISATFTGLTSAHKFNITIILFS